MSHITDGPGFQPTGGDPMSESLEQVQAECNWLLNLLHSLFARSGDAAPLPPTNPKIPEALQEQFTRCNPGEPVQCAVAGRARRA